MTRLLGPAVVLALALAMGPGCSSLTPRVDPGRPTALMKETGTTMSAVELRQRVDDMVAPLLAVIEVSMDQVRAESSDPELRRRALQLKIDAVPVVYRAAFQSDPLAGIMDLWLLSYQMEECLERGEGPCELGAEQDAAYQRAAAHRQRFEAGLLRVSEDPDAVRAMQKDIAAIAERFPLTGRGAIARRYTMTVELAEAVGSESRDAFNVLGDVGMTLAELSTRLNTYIGDVGRLARWHAELLLEDLALRPEVGARLADLEQATEDLNRISTALESIEDTLEPESVKVILDRTLALVSEERGVVLGDVERQRELTLRYVSAERNLLLEAIAAERRAVLDQIHQERVATLAEVDALGERYLEATTARALRVVDHLMWRLLQLTLILLVLAALLAWVVLRVGGLELVAKGGNGGKGQR